LQPAKKIDVATIRAKVRRNEFSFTGHAVVEGRKEGVTPHDVRQVLLTGEIIEEYPERRRCLISGHTKENIPVHVTCEYRDWLEDEHEDLVVVTVYVPSKSRWVRDRLRKKR
jgi:hypothetical protein